MTAIKIKQNVFLAGASDPDRKLFDALIPLKKGTTYNSYIIIGSEKTALIDTVDPVKSNELFENIKSLNIKKIDYIVANHAEQDHSGSLPVILNTFPDAKIMCTEMCKNLLIDLLNIDEHKFQTVKDKEILSLGDKTLEFIHTPWVHWPETMCTYLHEDKILFSCDFFGAHYSTKDLINDNTKEHEEFAKKYFAEIMMPFRIMIRNNLKKLSEYKINTIAPSHGPIYKNPKTIIQLYNGWVSDDVKNNVIIIYVSMHNSTKIMAEYLAKELIRNGTIVHLYDATNFEFSDYTMNLVDSSTIVFGTPCLLGSIHPVMMNIINITNILKPKTRSISVIGSYGWGQNLQNEFINATKFLKAELIPSVIIKGAPKEKEFKELDVLAKNIIKRNMEIGVLK